VYAILITFTTVSWNILPPTIVFLSRSNESSGSIASLLQGFLISKGLRVVYLLDTRAASRTDSEAFEMHNFRTFGNADWEAVVHALLRWCPLIVVDVRSPSTGVFSELEFIFAEDLQFKSVFIIDEMSEPTMLDGIIMPPEKREHLIRCKEKALLNRLSYDINFRLPMMRVLERR
jgi:hypothetical protein